MKPLAFVLIFVLGFAFGVDIENDHQRKKLEREQWRHTSEQVAREGKTDKEWYQSQGN